MKNCNPDKRKLLLYVYNYEQPATASNQHEDVKKKKQN